MSLITMGMGTSDSGGVLYSPVVTGMILAALPVVLVGVTYPAREVQPVRVEGVIYG